MKENKLAFIKILEERWKSLPLEIIYKSFESLAGVDEPEFHPIKVELNENLSTEVENSEQPEH